LDAWKQAMELVTEIYAETRTFPKEELYGLTSQIRRAAVSVPANIAEGAARAGRREFVQFLHIARGSLSELETLIRVASNLGYIEKTKAASLAGQTDGTSALLSGLIRSLKRPKPA
jgi:four helix bundle protein